ncbi:MAG: hypothetical protein ACRDIB_09115, partial [Ardenticatenaceae bacterium]
MKDFKPNLLLLLALLLVACGPSQIDAPASTVEPMTGEPLSTPQPPSPARPTAVPLAPTDPLLQLDFEPTFSTPESFHPFGRVPPFTLLADGRLIYVEGSDDWTNRVTEVHLSPQEADMLLRQVWDMGFEQLESYLDQCQPVDEELTECTSDASYTILRARQPMGELREVKIYYDYGPAPDVLRAIRSFLEEYEHPAAEPYEPTRATLFIRPITPHGVTVQSWPLDSALLVPPAPDQAQWAVVLSGDELDRFLVAVSVNRGDFFFEHEGQGYAATLVPWLPGVDYTEEVADYGK